MVLVFFFFFPVGFWVLSCSVLTWREIHIFKLLSWTRHPALFEEGRNSCVEFPSRKWHEWKKTRTQHKSLTVKDLQAKGISTGFLHDLSSFSLAFEAHGADTPSIAPGGLKMDEKGVPGCGAFINYGLSKKGVMKSRQMKWGNSRITNPGLRSWDFR